MSNEIKQEVKEYLDEERRQQSTTYAYARHNFKITLDMFHVMSNVFKSDKQLAVFYYMLKNITKYSTVIIDNTYMKKRLGMTDQTYYGLIKRCIDNDLIKPIHVVGLGRGKKKYMVNPDMIFNYKKTKSKNLYAENQHLYNILHTLTIKEQLPLSITT